MSPLDGQTKQDVWNPFHGEGGVMPDSIPGDITPAEVGRMVRRLEVQVHEGFQGTHASVQHLQDMILNLSVTYVRLDLYLAQREAMQADVEGVRKVAMWALGLVCSTALGAVILGIISLSGAFGGGS